MLVSIKVAGAKYNMVSLDYIYILRKASSAWICNSFLNIKLFMKVWNLIWTCITETLCKFKMCC